MSRSEHCISPHLTISAFKAKPLNLADVRAKINGLQIIVYITGSDSLGAAFRKHKQISHTAELHREFQHFAHSV